MIQIKTIQLQTVSVVYNNRTKTVRYFVFYHLGLKRQTGTPAITLQC